MTGRISGVVTTTPSVFRVSLRDFVMRTLNDVCGRGAEKTLDSIEFLTWWEETLGREIEDLVCLTTDAVECDFHDPLMSKRFNEKLKTNAFFARRVLRQYIEKFNRKEIS